MSLASNRSARGLRLTTRYSASFSGLQGIPKVYLRNSLPAKTALDYVDDYEITPGYEYERDAATGAIKTIEKPWTINDDNGVSSYSLLPPAVVAGLDKSIGTGFRE